MFLVSMLPHWSIMSARLDGADKFGKMLPSGIYFVQLKTDTGTIKNKKMMFLK